MQPIAGARSFWWAAAGPLLPWYAELVLQNAWICINFFKDMNVFLILIPQLVFKNVKYFILKQLTQPMAMASFVDQSDRLDLSKVEWQDEAK